MNKNIFKSILAAVVGIVVGAALSIGTDKILEAVGVLPDNDLWVSAWIIILVLFYRGVYNVIGSYIVAKMAPSNPMKHVIIVGILGTIAAAAGAIVTADMNLGPAWYAWTLAVITLPTSWIGGKWAIRNSLIKQ